MRTLDIRGALRRRWYLLLVGLLGTAGLAFLAFRSIGPTQEMRASALLLPPTVSVVADQPTSINPFLRLDGIDPALSVLVSRMTSDEMSNRMLEGTTATDYTLEKDPLSQAPVVIVSVTGKDEREAALVLKRIAQQQLPVTMKDLQNEAGVRPAAQIKLLPLVQDQTPEKVWSGLVRIEILIIGVGLVGTLLLSGLWDSVARSRSAARRKDDEAGSPATDEEALLSPSTQPVAEPVAEPVAAPVAEPGPVRPEPVAARMESADRPVPPSHVEPADEPEDDTDDGPDDDADEGRELEPVAVGGEPSAVSTPGPVRVARPAAVPRSGNLSKRGKGRSGLRQVKAKPR